MAPTEFKLFSLLPPELRRAIWELCLPRRVAELDQVMRNPYTSEPDSTQPCCDFAWTSGANSLPPIIWAVCHEAREIVLEGGAPLDEHKWDPSWQHPDDDDDGGNQYYAMNLISSPWVDTRTDLMHLNYIPRLAPFYDAQGDALDILVSEIHRCQGVSLMAEVLLEFSEPLRELKAGWYDAEQRILRRLTEYFVTIKMVTIHVPRTTAARAGVFGLLGDAPIQLVDPYDLDRIRGFYNLWMQASAEVTEPKAAFDFFLSGTPRFHSLVAAWKAEVEALWVWSESTDWYRLRESNNDLDPGMWLDWSNGEIEMGSRRRKPNRQHPEVRRILASMPVFRPMIMFRLCSRTCYLPEVSDPQH